MKIKIGDIFDAEFNENSYRKTGFRFLIVAEGKFYHDKSTIKRVNFTPTKQTEKQKPCYLGVKLGVDRDPYEYGGDCFWFDDCGLHIDDEMSFKLTRKSKYQDIYYYDEDIKTMGIK